MAFTKMEEIGAVAESQEFYFEHVKLKRPRDTPVFFPGESQGRGSLVGCHLWGHTESDTTEVTYQQQQQQRRTGEEVKW